MTIGQQRVLEEEILDQVSDEVAAANLADIARINALTGARIRLAADLRRYFQPQSAFSFLDVGAASGDFAAMVRRRYPSSRTFCLDLQHRNLRRAPGPRLQANAFQLPFPDRSIEVVHCSLFLHHFSDNECRKLIAEMFRVSSRLVLIQDLHRHWLSYYFLPFTRPIFRWNQVTVDDGMKSVAAGWRRKELESLLEGYPATIRWHFPSFRFFISIDRTC